MWYINNQPRPTISSYEEWKKDYDKRIFYFNLFVRGKVDYEQRENMMDELDKVLDNHPERGITITGNNK